MEDKGINKYLNMIKWFLIITVVLGIIIIIGYNIYNSYIINKTNNSFTNYLLNHDFKKNNDNTYTKNIENNDKEIEYTYTGSSKSISKNILRNTQSENSIISLIYKNNGIIEGTLQKHGPNKNNVYGNLLLTSTYNTKNKSFKCKILINDNFDIECNKLNKETKNFKNEIDKMCKENKIDIKYIK